MKYQAIFSSKKFKCHVLQFLFVASVRINLLPQAFFGFDVFTVGLTFSVGYSLFTLSQVLQINI